MNRLPRPTHRPQPTFELCISATKDADLLARLQSATQTVADVSTQFGTLAASASQYAISPHVGIPPLLSGAEMEGVYSRGMVRRGSPGRPVYEAIMSAAEHGMCPYCTVRTVSTLDHHLPKSSFSCLVVTPDNLVPSCADCNKGKLATAPTCANDVPLHPYFDNLGDIVWLIAKVVETSPASVKFEILPERAWPANLLGRVRSHFQMMRLYSLYASHSGQEIASIRYRLNIISVSDGAEGVRSFLTEMAESISNMHLNSWRAALYRALAKSDWFCEGGFSRG